MQPWRQLQVLSIVAGSQLRSQHMRPLNVYFTMRSADEAIQYYFVAAQEARHKM